jgi:hypothetical protein
MPSLGAGNCVNVCAVAPRGVEIMARNAPSVAAAFVSQAQRVVEVLRGSGRIAGREMKGPKLVQRPRFCLWVADLSGRAQGEFERLHKVEPAEEQSQKRREVAGDSQCFLVPSRSVQPSEEAKQRVDLLRNDLRVERFALSDGIEQAHATLAPRRNSRRVFHELLERGHTCWCFILAG